MAQKMIPASGAMLGGAAGLVGTLTVILIDPVLERLFNWDGFVMIALMGWAFGAVLAVMLRRSFGATRWQALLVLVLIPVIYYTAINLGINGYEFLENTFSALNASPGYVRFAIVGLIGGYVGSQLTVLILWYICQDLRHPPGFAAAVLGGTVAGAALVPLIDLLGGENGFYFVLHIIWQGVVMALIVRQFSSD